MAGNLCSLNVYIARLTHSIPRHATQAYDERTQSNHHRHPLPHRSSKHKRTNESRSKNQKSPRMVLDQLFHLNCSNQYFYPITESNDSFDPSSLFSSNLGNYSNGVGSLDFAPIPPEMSTSLMMLNRESFFETSARVLFMGVKWVKSLPSFTCLSVRDQLILLEESWAELFILSAIQWSMPLDKCSIFIAGNIPNGSDHSLDVRVLADIFERFRGLGVSSTELACLKALALFKTGKGYVETSTTFIYQLSLLVSPKQKRVASKMFPKLSRSRIKLKSCCCNMSKDSTRPETI